MGSGWNSGAALSVVVALNSNGEGKPCHPRPTLALNLEKIESGNAGRPRNATGPGQLENQ
jgi:hypothetical protein